MRAELQFRKFTPVAEEKKSWRVARFFIGRSDWKLHKNQIAVVL